MAPFSELWQRATPHVAPDSPWTGVARRTALVLVAMTVPVVVLVAWKAGFNSFPDESLHVATASYYLEHWLPPRTSAELSPYVGAHGVSYFMLWPPQAAYLLFAKASHLTWATDETRWLAYRGFCVGLWVVLVICVLREARRSPWALLLVGLTPQVWYLFTYFSADAFSYAVAALLVLQLGHAGTLSRRFLRNGTPVSGGLVLGACFGGLALSKMNYMTFALFAVVYCLVLAWRLGQPAMLLRRAALITATGALVAGPFLLSDLVNNGVDRDGHFEQLREELAAPTFKPSDIKAGTAYRGLALRERGVPAMALFSRPWKWGELTYRSFFGVYGAMDIFSPKRVNGLQALSSIALVCLAWLRRPRPRPAGRFLLVGVGLALSGLTVVAAFWRAWTFDFQAQGRYLFAVIPIAALMAMDGDERGAGPAHWGMFVVLALLGLWSMIAAAPLLV